MPTKPNKAGQQQNYVPAGNGDASGEYGDNATGSNKHFTNFKKPDENETKSFYTENNYNEAVSSITELIKQDDERRKKENQWTTEHDYAQIDELHNSDSIKHKESVLKMANAYKKQIETGEPYFIISDGFFSHGSCYYGGNKKGIVITPDTFRRITPNGYGTTWFHENGHLLDNTFVKEDGSRSNYSVDYVSKKYGTTLKDMLDKEFAAYFTKERKQEIINKIENIRKSIYQSYGYNLEEMESQKRELLDSIKPFKAELKANYDEIEKQLKNKEIDYWAYLRKRDRAKERYWSQTVDATNRINSMISKKSKEKIEQQVAREVYQNYSTITDMYSSLKKGRLHPEYGGYHDRKYWESEDSKRVKEFFAESFSGYTLENNHYKELKEAFPKSVEIFEEIYKEIQ